MWSRLVIGLLSLALCSVAQNVRITFVGQSCFLIQTLEQGPVVVTDPSSPATGYPMPAQPADVVTVSHNHSDHNYTAGIAGTPTLVDGRTITGIKEMSAAGMSFTLIPGYHDNRNGALRGPNAIIRWTQAGVRFAHLGDHGQDFLFESQLAELSDVDVLFIPAGGYYTIDAAGAAKVIAQLKPRIAILMHFRTPLGGPAQLATFPAVTFPFADFRYQPASAVVNPSALPQATEVWLMEPAAPVAAVSAAGFRAGQPVAPGSLAALFGQFPGASTQAAAGAPLSTRLGETEVLIGGAAAPLLYVSPAQINLQVPGKAQTAQHLVEVRVGGRSVARGVVTVIPVAPGVFAAVGPDGRFNAVRAGQTLTIYATGQGEVAPAVEDGAPAPVQPPAVTLTRPDVFIGYKSAPVLFSGLAPGWVGLWQINIAVPPDAPVGSAVPLIVNQGITSNALPIKVESGASCPVCACPGC